MSKRHWLRDEIDFGVFGARRPHWDICNNCQIGDDCENCNAHAQEIADSLALSGCDPLFLADLIARYRSVLTKCAKIEVRGF